MTFDEARMMANVNARADRLFIDGYRACCIGGAVLTIRSPKESVYRVDTDARTCSCPFFQAHLGHRPCKHVLGWQRLLSHQRSCRRLIAVLLLRTWAELDEACLPERTGEGRAS